MQQPEKLYRIIALDDHPMVLEGISHILTAMPNVTVEGVTSQRQLLEQLEGGRQFDLFILDLELSDADGFDVLKAIRHHAPDTAVLIYTMHEEPWILARLARLDIQGVVSKSNPVGKLSEAVAVIRDGGTYYNEALMQQLAILTDNNTDVMKSSPAFQLSEREQQVLQCISEGMTTPEISDRLFISTNTVGTYRLRLMKKFDAHNVAQLIAKAQRFLM
ncbi:MAG: response regulator transcription factor [Prevotella sp.]|nr:response regulator transcription factor [Prevotella sp.]